MNPPILTITQFTQALKLCLESTFPSAWLQGEVSNCKLQSSGHLYFCLKDAQAQISAVMFRGDLSILKTIPKDGDQLIVRGELSVYPPSGKYQIIVREVQYVGIGALLLKLEELKQKLQKRGWFDSKHKKALPKFPKKIGVVTSPTGAVIQDIINVLSRRFKGFNLILNPVKVQGEGAAQEIALAIQQFNQYNLVDVIIVGRGGGSIEDLWAFNEEIVAEAIFNSRIPIVSAVGHETDTCISDFVADVRAPTPSAAAELVIAEKTHQLQHLDHIHRRLHHIVCQWLKHYRQRLNTFQKIPLFQSPYLILSPWLQRIDHIKSDLDDIIKQKILERQLHLQGRKRQAFSLNPLNKIAHFKSKLYQFQKAFHHTIQGKISSRKNAFSAQVKYKQLTNAWQNIFHWRQHRLEKISSALHSINPKNILLKGYCIPFAEKDNSIITSIEDVEKNDAIRLLIADGEIISIVKELKPNESAARTEK